MTHTSLKPDLNCIQSVPAPRVATVSHASQPTGPPLSTSPHVLLSNIRKTSMDIISCASSTSTQWRRKIVEFRGAEARRRAMLPCFSPANIELSIVTNSPDDSLLLPWVHSESLPSESDKLSTSTLPSILHLFASLTRKERCNRYLRSDYGTNGVKLFKIMLG